MRVQNYYNGSYFIYYCYRYLWDIFWNPYTYAHVHFATDFSYFLIKNMGFLKIVLSFLQVFRDKGWVPYVLSGVGETRV